MVLIARTAKVISSILNIRHYVKGDLVKCDFIRISGSNINLNYPLGSSILDLNPFSLGCLKGN